MRNVIQIFSIVLFIAFCACTGNAPSYTVTVVCDEHVVAEPSSATIEYGKYFETVFHTKSGFIVSEVFINGIKDNNFVAGDSVYKSLVTSDRNITVKTSEAPKSYKVTATAGEGGSVSPSEQIVANGGTATITISTSNIVDTIKVNGVVQTLSSSILYGGSYEVKNISMNTTVYVAFRKSVYDITASVVGEGGSISPSGVRHVTSNGEHGFSIKTNNSGYMINQILVDGKSVDFDKLNPTSFTYTFSNVRSDHTIEASFKKVDIYWMVTDGYWHCDSTYIYDKNQKVWDKYIDESNEDRYYQTNMYVVTYWNGKKVGNYEWSIDYSKNPPTFKTGDSYTVVSVNDEKMVLINVGKDALLIYSHRKN